MNELQKCKDYCFKYLSTCLVSSKSLNDKLYRKEFSQDVINETIEMLLEYGYLNDEKYAKNYVYNAYNFKSWGPYKIKMKMLEKGIQKDISEKYLSQYDFYEKCLDYASRRFEKTGDVNKTISFLKNRGFNFDNIIKAVKEVQ